jgi:hypothetical protein
MADASTPGNAEGAAADLPPGGIPTIESTITVAPTPAPESPGASEGGEWDQLVSQVRQWWASGAAAALWQRARTPALALALLLAGVTVLRIYGALIQAIDGIPLFAGLLELVGLIWLLRFGMPRLLRSQERQQLVDGLRRRWQAFSGG